VLGVVRGVSYGLFRKPDPFMAELRALGARLVRIFLYWSQIEPEHGRYDAGVVDTFLSELDGSERVWVTVCSSSTWATRQAATFLPPSPAKDLECYRAFVRRLVSHCAGRVHYWQCDNEPSNVGLTWAGTAAEYVEQLKVMHRAVDEADPHAAVVLGGAPYALPTSAPDSAERRFFDVLLRDGRDHFDFFDLHLYADAEKIPRDIETVRGMMRAHGYERPVLIGEYGAPTPEQFPDARAAIYQAMTAAFAAQVAPSAGAQHDPKDSKPAAAPAPTPDRAAVAALYQRMSSLPESLQMFMAGCAPALEERRTRLQCREIVMRNLLALSAGVRVTACWKLGPEVSNYEDPLSIMELFYGKLLLLGYEDARLRRRLPAADTFALLSQRLHDVESVARIEVPSQPRVRLFDVRRRAGGALLVAWTHDDAAPGSNDTTTTLLSWPWTAARAAAIDALGARHHAEVSDRRVSVRLSATPMFIEA